MESMTHGGHDPWRVGCGGDLTRRASAVTECNDRNVLICSTISYCTMHPAVPYRTMHPPPTHLFLCAPPHPSSPSPLTPRYILTLPVRATTAAAAQVSLPPTCPPACPPQCVPPCTHACMHACVPPPYPAAPYHCCCPNAATPTAAAPTAATRTVATLIPLILLLHLLRCPYCCYPYCCCPGTPVRYDVLRPCQVWCTAGTPVRYDVLPVPLSGMMYCRYPCQV